MGGGRENFSIAGSHFCICHNVLGATPNMVIDYTNAVKSPACRTGTGLFPRRWSRSVVRRYLCKYWTPSLIPQNQTEPQSWLINLVDILPNWPASRHTTSVLGFVSDCSFGENIINTESSLKYTHTSRYITQAYVVTMKHNNFVI